MFKAISPTHCHACSSNGGAAAPHPVAASRPTSRLTISSGTASATASTYISPTRSHATRPALVRRPVRGEQDDDNGRGRRPDAHISEEQEEPLQRIEGDDPLARQPDTDVVKA